jgi:hypothetical protein
MLVLCTQFILSIQKYTKELSEMSLRLLKADHIQYNIALFETDNSAGAFDTPVMMAILNRPFPGD